MKKNWPLRTGGIALFLITMISAAPAEDLKLIDYIDLYLKNSDTLASGADSLETKELDLQGAKVSKASEIEIIELTNARDQAKLDLQKSRNSEVRKAADLFFKVLQVERSLEIAEADLAAARETIAYEEEQYKLDLLAESDIISRRITFLNSQDSERSSRQSYDDAVKNLLRPVEMKGQVTLIDPGLQDLIGTEDFISLDLEKIKNKDSSWFKAARALEVQQRKTDGVLNSPYSKEDEKEDARDALETAKDQMQTAQYNLEDQVLSLNRKNESLTSQLEKTELSLAQMKITLDSTELKRSYGDKTQLDYQKTLTSFRKTSNELVKLHEDFLLQILDCTAANGADCRDFLAGILKK